MRKTKTISKSFLEIKAQKEWQSRTFLSRDKQISIAPDGITEFQTGNVPELLMKDSVIFSILQI